MMLTVVCGPPGTGKTTISEWITSQLDACLIRTDVVRNEVIDNPEYTETERKRVYEDLFLQTRTKLRAGCNVVADGTFDRREYRDRSRKISEEANVDFKLVRVTCDPEEVERRIKCRTNDESDATVQNYLEIKAEFESIREPHVRIDNSESWQTTKQQLMKYF